MKELKNILMLMVALLATTAFAACGDDDNLLPVVVHLFQN